MCGTQILHTYVPNVGAPVTLDLRNIRQTSHREPEELPVKCASDRLADGGFANTRGTCKTDDFAFDGTPKLADSEELQDTVLNVLQAVVVLIKNLLRVRNRVVLWRMLSPWNLHNVRQHENKSKRENACVPV